MNRFTQGVCAAGLLLLLSGCESSTAVSTGSANPADLQFVSNAARIIKFDQEECTDAQTRAKNPEVRALAAQLLDEANAFQAKLVPAASAAGIKLPTELDDMRRIRLGHMRLENGLDFDRAFIDDQIASHQDTLALNQSMPPGASPGIAQLASQGNTIVSANLQKLYELRQSMPQALSGPRLR